MRCGMCYRNESTALALGEDVAVSHSWRSSAGNMVSSIKAGRQNRTTKARFSGVSDPLHFSLHIYCYSICQGDERRRRFSAQEDLPAPALYIVTTQTPAFLASGCHLIFNGTSTLQVYYLRGVAGGKKPAYHGMGRGWLERKGFTSQAGWKQIRSDSGQEHSGSTSDAERCRGTREYQTKYNLRHSM
jgi:hypothetical protein